MSTPAWFVRTLSDFEAEIGETRFRLECVLGERDAWAR